MVHAGLGLKSMSPSNEEPRDASKSKVRETRTKSGIHSRGMSVGLNGEWYKCIRNINNKNTIENQCAGTRRISGQTQGHPDLLPIPLRAADLAAA